MLEKEIYGNPELAHVFDEDNTLGRKGIGSKITIRYGEGKSQIREIKASGGFVSFDAPIAHFGLAEVKSIDSIEVDWGNKSERTYKGPFKSGRKYKISRN